MLLCFGEYELDDQRCELRSRGVKVPVQPKVLDVLFYLVRARERAVSREELLNAIWPGVAVSQASIWRAIMEARKAIGDEMHQVLVTVPRRGFRFAASVQERHRERVPGPTAGLAPDDVCRLLRLLGECHEIRRGGDDATLHLLRGLALLTQSQVALRMDTLPLALDAPPVVDGVFDIGWANASDRDRVYGYALQRPLGSDPLNAAVFNAEGDIVTRTRSDAVPFRTWRRTDAHNEVHRPSRVDDSLMSLSRPPAGRGRGRVLVFKRSWGEPQYGPRERDLVHLAHAECAWALASS